MAIFNLETMRNIEPDEQDGWPVVLKNDGGIRPAGNPDQCFYCGRKVGQPHKSDCVTVVKLVKVRYVYEIEIIVPHFWQQEDVEWHRNDGSWCADNADGDIEAYAHRSGAECHCPFFKCEFIGPVDDTPRRADDDKADDEEAP